MAKTPTKGKGKKAEPEGHVCEWCKKSFLRESSLIAHMCEPKRRWLNRDEKYVKLAYYAYTRFYAISYPSKKQPDYRHFADSKYYTGFVKFARHLLQINAIYPEQFVDFLIKTAVKLKDWTSDSVYEVYIRELSKKETAEEALMRNIMLMEQWSHESNLPWTEFFRQVNPQLATRWIRMGRISPWVLYQAPSASVLFERLSDEQMALIKEAIDPSFWNARFKVCRDDAEWVRTQLTEAGL